MPRPPFRLPRIKDSDDDDDDDVQMLEDSDGPLRNGRRVKDLIHSLDTKTVNRILFEAACRHSDVIETLEAGHENCTSEDEIENMSFKYLYKLIWMTLNKTYAELNASQAFAMSEDASADIETCLQTIREKCPKNACFETKKDALEALRKVGKSICLSQGVIAREIRSAGTVEWLLVTIMLEVVESLKAGEIEKLKLWCEDKLVKLKNLRGREAIFTGLREILDRFGGVGQHKDDVDSYDCDIEDNDEGGDMDKDEVESEVDEEDEDEKKDDDDEMG